MSIDPAYELYERKRFKSFFRTTPTTAFVQFGITKMIEMFGWRKLISITQAEDVFFGVNLINALIESPRFNSCPQFISVTEGILSQRGIIYDTSVTIQSDTAVFPYRLVFDKVAGLFSSIVL